MISWKNLLPCRSLLKSSTRALEYRRLVLENRLLRAAAGQADDLEQRLVGRSNAMIDLRRRMRTIGPTEADVLIVGRNRRRAKRWWRARCMICRRVRNALW